MSKLTREAFRKEVEGKLEVSKAKLEEFKTTLDQNPEHAFEWADSTVLAAARVTVALIVLNLIEHAEFPVKATKEVCHREAWNRARGGSSSSSDSHNLMAKNMMRAHAEMYDTYEHMEDA